MRTESIAKLACAYSGVMWGLYWLPLRQLHESGFGAWWATVAFYAVPFFMALPVIAWRWREARAGGLWLQVLSAVAAFGLMFYSAALLHTEIVRALLLFYTTPFWSALLARVFIGEPVTPVRWAAMGVGLLGLIVIVRADSGLFWPDRSGDWMALAAGFLWSVTTVMLRAGNRTHPIDLTAHNFLWGGLFALLFAAVLADFGTAPAPALLIAELPWLVPVTIAVVMTGYYASMWGVPKIDPGLSGLLFMTEISTGAITAAIWAGEPFGLRELIGVVLITAAGALESIRDLAARAAKRA